MILTKKQEILKNKYGLIFYKNKYGKIDIKKNKNYQKYLIEQNFIQKIKTITEKYPKEEREGWDLQLKEAEKVINGEGSAIIDELAQANGITSLEFANLVKQKANDYALAYATALAEKQKKLKELEN